MGGQTERLRHTTNYINRFVFQELPAGVFLKVLTVKLQINDVIVCFHSRLSVLLQQQSAPSFSSRRFLTISFSLSPFFNRHTHSNTYLVMFLLSFQYGHYFVINYTYRVHYIKCISTYFTMQLKDIL